MALALLDAGALRTNGTKNPIKNGNKMPAMMFANRARESAQVAGCDVEILKRVRGRGTLHTARGESVETTYYFTIMRRKTGQHAGTIHVIGEINARMTALIAAAEGGARLRMEDGHTYELAIHHLTSTKAEARILRPSGPLVEFPPRQGDTALQGEDR